MIVSLILLFVAIKANAKSAYLSQVGTKPCCHCGSLIGHSQLVHIAKETRDKQEKLEVISLSHIYSVILQVSISFKYELDEYCTPRFLSPFSIVKSTYDYSVPQGIHLAASIVHHPGQPGMDGFGTVAVTITQQLLINPVHTSDDA